MRGWIVGVLIVGAGCREYHPDLPFEECQPYPLACATCSFADDAANDELLLRIWRCEAEDGRLLDAVARGAIESHTHALLEAEDVHFYEAETGLRIAAVREWVEPVDVCGRMLEQEWYGEILSTCTPTCEHDPSLEGADPSLTRCPPVL